MARTGPSQAPGASELEPLREPLEIVLARPEATGGPYPAGPGQVADDDPPLRELLHDLRWIICPPGDQCRLARFAHDFDPLGEQLPTAVGDLARVLEALRAAVACERKRLQQAGDRARRQPARIEALGPWTRDVVRELPRHVGGERHAELLDS